MDKNSNAKQTVKKQQMAVEKSKKSASKKKKKNKKITSSKSDQSPDSFEVEGIRVLDQTGGESDTSSVAQQARGSPALPSQSHKLSASAETEKQSPVGQKSPNNDNDAVKPQKPNSGSRKLPLETVCNPATLKHSNSASILTDKVEKNSGGLKRSTVSFSNFEEIQTISGALSNMSVKSKNGSQRGKSKASSKASSNGATKREKVKVEPIKSSISKAAEAISKLKSEESLRWENSLQDEDQELERIRIYKINRRKRYLAAAQAKGLGWVVNYGSNGSPVEQVTASTTTSTASVEFIEHETHASVTDFSPVRSIMPSHNSASMGMGSEVTC